MFYTFHHPFPQFWALLTVTYYSDGTSLQQLPLALCFVDSVVILTHNLQDFHVLMNNALQTSLGHLKQYCVCMKLQPHCTNAVSSMSTGVKVGVLVNNVFLSCLLYFYLINSQIQDF